MRALIVSDIHSNLTALEAVLTAAEDEGPIDQLWCLGDIVGYGPWPVECIERLRGLHALSICGNHDAGATGRMSLDGFNHYAAQACRWTDNQLTSDSREYLISLPETLEEEGFTFDYPLET